MKLCITFFCIFSGKSLTPDGTAKLRNQIIDAPWVTPGQFTQAPSLDCIFSQCYSIKSWLDLRSDHVAIVHCSNGRSRSGILIACLLKYIGAFDHASQAFDFFCSARYVSHCILGCLLIWWRNWMTYLFFPFTELQISKYFFSENTLSSQKQIYCQFFKLLLILLIVCTCTESNVMLSQL